MVLIVKVENGLWLLFSFVVMCFDLVRFCVRELVVNVFFIVLLLFGFNDLLLFVFCRYCLWVGFGSFSNGVLLYKRLLCEWC